MIAVIVSAVLLAFQAAPAAQPAPKQTIRTRVPQAHIDAFMDACGKDSPRASCWCMAEKLNATGDGQFVLDVVGLQKANPKAGRPEVLQAVNRHGMRPSQAKAAVERTEALVGAAAKDCG